MGAFERQLAASRGVQRVVHAAANEIGARARGLLSAHRVTGNAEIKVDHSGVDSEVTLDDPASLSIEFGRGAYTRADGRRVGAMEGLHILGRAIR